MMGSEYTPWSKANEPKKVDRTIALNSSCSSSLNGRGYEKMCGVLIVGMRGCMREGVLTAGYVRGGIY